MNPYDPRTPLYEGQQPVQPQVQSPVPQQQVAPSAPAGLHFLEAAGHVLLAGVHFFTGGGDEEGEVEEAPARRRPRPRFGPTPARVGAGSCCRAKRPTKP